MFLGCPKRTAHLKRMAVTGGLSMRLLTCAGGTGGGVYPALAVLRTPAAQRTTADPAQPDPGLSHPDDLRRVPDPAWIETDILWVGSVGGMEAELVKREGLRYTEIPAAGVHGVGLRRLPGNLAA